jgi:hypothetical protein
MHNNWDHHAVYFYLENMFSYCNLNDTGHNLFNKEWVPTVVCPWAVVWNRKDTNVRHLKEHVSHLLSRMTEGITTTVWFGGCQGAFPRGSPQPRPFIAQTRSQFTPWYSDADRTRQGGLAIHFQNGTCTELTAELMCGGLELYRIKVVLGQYTRI